MAIVLSNYFMEQALQDLVEDSLSGLFTGILQGAKIIPFTAAITPTPTTPLATFVVPTSPGLVPQSCAFGAPARKLGGGFGVQGALNRFSMSDASQPTVAYGYLVTDAGGTNVLFSELLPGGRFNFNDQYDQLGIGAQFVLGGLNFGSATIED